jgi:hypothetical protein
VCWSREFDEPIPLPDSGDHPPSIGIDLPRSIPLGRQLVTLRDTAEYITGLPKAEHDATEWQAAIKALMVVVEHGGPTMQARIGIMRALNRQVQRTFGSSRNATHWGERNLKGDQ